MATIRVAREGGRKVDEIEWKAEELDIVEKPNGPAFAAMIAAGIGTLALGIFTTWAEASESFAQDVLKLDNGVGPLSGKTVFAVVAFLVSWAILAPLLWRRNLPFATALAIAAILMAGGFIGTFPKFFELFASD